VFYFLSALPIFLVLKEKTKPQTLPAGENYWSIAFKRLRKTWNEVGKVRPFVMFVIAFLVFNCGIMMILDFAGIIGATLFEMKQQQLIIFMIIVQITSVIGALVFGKLTDRISTKRSLVAAIILMVVVESGLFFVNSLVGFYIIGALAGLALTGVQSVSRTAVGQLAPEEKSTEYFGIFSLAGQVSAFIGPTVYGMLATSFALARERAGWETVAAEQTGIRLAVIAVIAFLLVGLGLLSLVRNWHKRDSESQP